MIANDEFTSPDCNKRPGVFSNRRFRVLEDINNRGTPESDGSLPKIYEENEDGKENYCNQESTPRKRVIYKSRNKECSDIPAASSTPLSRRQPTPKTPQRIPHNPFEAELISRLHLPICSPSVFSVVVSPTKSLDGSFEWTIEDVSRIKPVAIEEFPEHQFNYVEDPETESRVQEAIDTFFKEKQIVPSPWSSNEVRQPILPFNTRGKITETKDISTQTTLSLPAVLPPELELMLKPYFNQDCNDVEEDIPSPLVEEALSQSGLRRKLMFHVTEEMCQVSPSSPLVRACWKEGLSRTNLQGSRSHLRSPTLSPIGHTESPASSHADNSVIHSSRMSMDVSYQSIHGTPQMPHHSLISAITEGEEMCSSQNGWSIRRHLQIEEEVDQTMDSCNGTPIMGNSPTPIIKHKHIMSNITDLGYHTDSSSLNNFAHSKLRLDSWGDSDERF